MNILIADDDPVTLKLLCERAGAWGHTIHRAADGQSAWKTICSTPIDVVVSDWMMPELDGLELCRRIRDRQDSGYIYLILISAQDSQADIVRGLESGVDDYITKPIDLDALRARIEIGVRIVNLERMLNRKIEIITANHVQTIRMFSQLMEVVDDDLGGHCRRTAQLAVELARRHPGVGDAEIPVIETAALLHDIGMVGIPKGILNKSRTEMINDERQLYQSHAAMGARILGEIEIMKPAALLVGMHHEQINGKGFPDGLAGDDIPVGAQLISAASIYDNMIHRGKIALDDIPERLQRINGYLLSPQVVALLLEVNVARQHDLARQTDEERSLDELTAGMVLAANVRMKTGAFVMAAGTALDDYGIEKLRQYHTIGTITDKVLIRKSSVRE
ncbi:two-component system response regulator [Desulfosarcina alkanivorans]|uniref:Two-component system response regulator n=1 Tax=Desulfosarcina alkanivorans TaxID=571177 RepID=A0A5K7YJ75_9BACT|nr:HD domain-containing phosphohydrolase [Desulfosarcina alkanivorans]BBO66791.1 two-component system response regulator [Desulfosarcina alkanivorans]